MKYSYLYASPMFALFYSVMLGLPFQWCSTVGLIVEEVVGEKLKVRWNATRVW
jgi:hypothetical protein